MAEAPEKAKKVLEAGTTWRWEGIEIPSCVLRSMSRSVWCSVGRGGAQSADLPVRATQPPCDSLPSERVGSVSGSSGAPPPSDGPLVLPSAVLNNH